MFAYADVMKTEEAARVRVLAEGQDPTQGKFAFCEGTDGERLSAGHVLPEPKYAPGEAELSHLLFAYDGGKAADDFYQKVCEENSGMPAVRDKKAIRAQTCKHLINMADSGLITSPEKKQYMQHFDKGELVRCLHVSATWRDNRLIQLLGTFSLARSLFLSRSLSGSFSGSLSTSHTSSLISIDTFFIHLSTTKWYVHA